MKPDRFWLKTRLQLLNRLKSQVAMRLGTPSPELRFYTQKFQADWPKRWRRSDKRALLDEIGRAAFVLGADFHAFSQAQRLHLRLLRSLAAGQSVTLGCEFLEARHQKWVDLLQAGRLSEKQFLRKTNWLKRWGFPWEPYSHLMNLARERGMKVLALNHIGKQYSLVKRDQLAARLLAEHYRKHPEQLHYVVFGELHLAESHLLKCLRRELKNAPLSTVVIFQDQDEMYFRLARKGLENQVEVLRAKGNRFCVLGSPPWVKWQSYAMYLEHTFDHDLQDSSAEDESTLDLSHQAKTMVELLGRDLGIEVDAAALTIYSSSEAQLWRDLRLALRPFELKIARAFVEQDRSFYLPRHHIAYVARLTVNHVADMAGRYIHAQLSGRKALAWEMPKDFLALIWIEAVGFFCSKLINHKRAASTAADLRVQLVAPGDERARDVLALALQQRRKEVFVAQGLERSYQRVGKPRRRQSYLEAANILGSMMGERLYQSYRRRWISKQTLLSWLKHDVHEKSFVSLYYEIVRRLEPGEKLGRSRAERL